ncbi:MAG TPA: type IV toxin-antitoxin system AbiEi family antitoxin domain-containing protein [Solirubrobacteraceae bacterium]|nr:type IV toxin-antitoxin system AbiEi family antitoxin domain-containing protein [Solirubrobacteraceae bacterium]
MADVRLHPDSSALHRLAYSQEGLFTAQQAQERGYSAQLLAHHARTGRFTRVRRGLYRLSDYPTGEHEEIRAAWLAVGMERAIVSHESALVLHGLSDVLPNTVHLLVSRGHRGIRAPAGVTLHTATEVLPDDEIATRYGIRVTTPARSIIDAAGSGTAPEQIQMGIRQALDQGRTTPSQLAGQAERHGGQVAALVRRTIQEAQVA